MMMNELANVARLTMSSLEIAELTGKRHDNVMRDCRKQFEELGEAPLKFEGTYRDGQGKEQPCYHLDKRHTMTLVSGYLTVLRDRVVQRWMELEKGGVTLNKVLEILAETQRIQAMESVKTREELKEHGKKIEKLENKVTAIEEYIPRRKKVSPMTRAEHVHAVKTRGGRCPHCNKAQLFASDGTFIGQIDHYHAPHRNKVTETWPMCKECHALKTKGEIAEPELRTHFESYQFFRVSIRPQLELKI